MNLETQIMDKLKEAMRNKDQAALRTLRAIKSEILKEKTSEGFSGEISEETELKMLTKMAKQRKDSMAVFNEQGREDLAQTEEEELLVIQQFLPEQMSEDEVKQKVESIIQQVGASSQADIGKVMGIAMKELQGKADGKLISALARQLLSS